MPSYMIEEGLFVNTAIAKRRWANAVRWDGENSVSIVTGNRWESEMLCQSSKGRYYIIHTGKDRNGKELSNARWATSRVAAAWLFLNDHDLPPDLKEFEGNLEE